MVSVGSIHVPRQPEDHVRRILPMSGKSLARVVAPLKAPWHEYTKHNGNVSLLQFSIC